MDWGLVLTGMTKSWGSLLPPQAGYSTWEHSPAFRFIRNGGRKGPQEDFSPGSCWKRASSRSCGLWLCPGSTETQQEQRSRSELLLEWCLTRRWMFNPSLPSCNLESLPLALLCATIFRRLLRWVENESSLLLSLLFTRLNKPAPLTPCR